MRRSRRVTGAESPTKAADLPEAVTVADAARLFGVSPRTVHRYARKGWLRVFFLPSGRPRVPLDEINRIRRQTDPAQAARDRGAAARAPWPPRRVPVARRRLAARASR